MQFKGSKKVLVPKTMIVGNEFDKFDRLILFLSLEHEVYDTQIVAGLLGYRTKYGITHKNIDTEKLMKRRSGECSPVVDIKALAQFTNIHFSDMLKVSLGKKNALAVYPLGERYFFCMDGKTFIAKYKETLQSAKIRHNL